MEGDVVMRRSTLSAAMALAACGSQPPATQSPPALPPARVTRDSMSTALVPPGYGTLHQDDISIILQPNGVRVTALPLDESIIRLLAPDSYRSMRSILEAKRQQIAQRAQLRGIQNPRVWYVRFYGLTPDAHFVPTDFSILSGGREYRPFDVIPITGGFGDQRLQPRDTQAGLLLFEEGVDVTQPLSVTMGAERNTDWSLDDILKKLDAERASVRARAGAHP
ncbi:MAG TPA: hypothetical protein VN706_23405 [Gemmatimonadaceae bacterium]|nr:hypothetical protein [Gemmatimonadaceae bacterium]